VKLNQWRPWLRVVAGGESLISSAGGSLLTRTARVTGLERALAQALKPWLLPNSVHHPAKIVTDLAVTVALGGDCAADIAVLRGQPGVFGMVASDPTVSRAVDRLAAVGGDVLTAIRAARATARGWVWQRTGPPTQHGWLVLDPDATLITAHSEKQDAAKTWKKTFGHHPLLVFCDHGQGGTGEPVAGLLRRGNAGSNTAVDHITVLDDALAQIPASLRTPDDEGRVKVLVRTDAAGATHAFTHHIATQGMEFSVGANLSHFDTDHILRTIVKRTWTPAYNAERNPRDGAGWPRPPAWSTCPRGLRGPG
jgi:hypothetical protein